MFQHHENPWRAQNSMDIWIEQQSFCLAEINVFLCVRKILMSRFLLTFLKEFKKRAHTQTQTSSLRCNIHTHIHQCHAHAHSQLSQLSKIKDGGAPVDTLDMTSRPRVFLLTASGSCHPNAILPAFITCWAAQHVTGPGLLSCHGADQPCVAAT